jgi:hypothetical protein
VFLREKNTVVGFAEQDYLTRLCARYCDLNFLRLGISALTDLTSLASEFDEPNKLLIEAQIQINEATQQLRRFLESQEIEPQRMQELDNQISIDNAINLLDYFDLLRI